MDHLPRFTKEDWRNAIETDKNKRQRTDIFLFVLFFISLMVVVGLLWSIWPKLW